MFIVLSFHCRASEDTGRIRTAVNRALQARAYRSATVS
jgi:hypothetical protein